MLDVFLQLGLDQNFINGGNPLPPSLLEFVRDDR